MSLMLASLRVYPVKSCRGIDVAAWDVDRLGLALDRAFMIVEEDTGLFITQRRDPVLARIVPVLHDDTMVLTASGVTPVHVPLRQTEGPRRPVTVWRHEGVGVDQGDEVAAWLSAHIGRRARLVRAPPDHARRVNPERTTVEAHTAFSDGYPLLLVSQASVDALNARLELPVDVARFPPNLVVAGSAPFAEDGWRRLRIGPLDVVIVKPCERCVITTLDPEQGVRTGDEPLRTLASFRRTAEGVLFAQNAIALQTGRLAVGDVVDVAETQQPPVFETVG